MGEGSIDGGWSTAVDASGNVYTTGSFAGTVDFDPGSGTHYLISYGSIDIFISKLDVAGNFVWAKSIGGSLGDRGNSIKVDASGNVYTTGYFTGTVDFDPGPGIYNLTSTSHNADLQMFVLKLDSSGNFVWAKGILGVTINNNNTGRVIGDEITIDAAGNIYTTGTFQRTVDFDPGTGNYYLNTSGSDIFISKLGASGNFIWAKQIRGSCFDSYSIAIDVSGNVFTTGCFDGTSDFDPGPETYNLTGSSDLFISKLDALGNFIWAKKMNCTGPQSAYSIAIDASGNIFTTGYFRGSADFDPGSGTYNLTASGYSDIFISKLDALGNFLWAKRIGGESGSLDVGYSIAVDYSGNVYTTGNFYDAVDFDPSPGTYNLTASGSSDIFISKLGSSGNFIWAKQIGGVTTDQSNFITLDAVGNVYATGSFIGTADFDPGPDIYNLTSEGSSDIFVVKLHGDPIVYTSPKIYTTKAALNVDETQTITGKDFTAGGQINLFITNSIGDLIPVNSITYLPNGGFSYQLPITSTMPNGEYSVYATDINTGQTTTSIKFRVNNPVVRKLWINKPLGNDTYITGQEFQINWGDYIDNTLAVGQSGHVQKKYKIEITNNNGSSWIVIKDELIIPVAVSGQNNNNFRYSYRSNTSGNYKIKITDKETPSNFNISEEFTVANCNTGGFKSTLVWDKSSPVPDKAPKPIGLAADGTCRILIELDRQPGNTKEVSQIKATIKPVTDPTYAGTKLLGKIIHADNPTVYTEEANNADSTTVDWPANQSLNSTSFWLVAPDDFTNNLDDQRESREINVEFLITYSDNTTELVSTSPCYPISIRRPALMLVYGLNGRPTTFADFMYKKNSTEYQRFDGENSPWKIRKRTELKTDASYITNAKIVLGLQKTLLGITLNPGDYENSFQFLLDQMHADGFANNRVDYVCHSMGGCVARTIINQFSGINQTADDYRPAPGSKAKFKNYGKGFINKLITINTPHNGSFVADFAIDRYSSLIGLFVTQNDFVQLATSIGDFFVITPSPFPPFWAYKPAPAIEDLRASDGGIKFTQTTVKNHLIASVVDPLNALGEAALMNLNKQYKLFSKILLRPNGETVGGYMNSKFSNTDYLYNTDLVVPLSSQLPGKNLSSDLTDIEVNPNGETTASIIYGTSKQHEGRGRDPIVGQRVFHLLNASFNSGFFASEIAANPSQASGTVYRNASIPNTTYNYYDTTFIKIVNPTGNIVYVDSTVQIRMNLKDTIRLQEIRLGFQGEMYTSSSAVSDQSFNLKINSSGIGRNILVAQARYDSSGYIVNHIDTITLNVKSLDTLEGFYIYPKSQNLNPEQVFQHEFNAVYTNYIGTLNNDIDSLSFTIADTNVVKFDSSIYRFVTKDTGSTHIIFNYKGFLDTAFIYISTPSDENITKACSQSSLSFFAGTTDNTKTYQWQADAGTGFINISDNAVYSGASTPTLTLTGAPSSLYGYRFQCLISDAIGTVFGPITTLKFSSTWTGATDNAWENPANWSCSAMPDSNTDIVISSTAARFPEVNSNVTCRSLTVQTGATVIIKLGARLMVQE